MDSVKIFWLKQSLQDIPDNREWLHNSEKKVLSGFKFSKKRNDWLLGRWTAKNAVKHFLGATHPGLSHTSVEIIAAEDGAPEVYHKGNHLPAYISLSHSNGTGICAVSSPDVKIGCDLEKIEPRSQFLVNDHFTKHEQKLISTNDRDLKALWTNLVWSAKESALKTLREGLRIDTLRIEVDFNRQFDRDNWNKLKATFLDGQMEFKGSWQYTSEFVLTILSNQESIEPIEIRLTH